MNGQIKKYIYMIVTICVVVLAGIVFIKILPWLILAGVIAYGIIKIRSVFKERDALNNSEFKSEHNNEDSFENSSDSYTNGDIIDVDYEEVDKEK
ncbi:hypothetical protein CLPUN_45980 [Clostridium puniceum]|uniref:Uncharacterized protein n=1 Tax=Clostridium puniceum TaxID=29367 RepID=A0A1S8T6I6_9CLOT|nr:hypothetical protein [Clostridium puniceum]OOM73397.1 hypothetical protein CLPUN_45980 [Clostridium puniceum]